MINVRVVIFYQKGRGNHSVWLREGKSHRNLGWWFMWWCNTPLYNVTKLIITWFDQYPYNHLNHHHHFNRIIKIISGIVTMIHSCVIHSYYSSRTIKIISDIITMIYSFLIMALSPIDLLKSFLESWHYLAWISDDHF